MIPYILSYAAVVLALTSLVSAHACIWHPSMWGFNVTDTNRPQDPLMNLPFEKWWFHGHLNHPPHPEDIKELPVGESSMFEISCDKDSTSYWPSGPGGNLIDHNNPDYPCPGQPTTEFHTNGINDLGGCALAVAYESDVSKVKPEDFVVFSVNQTCVWYLHTYFEVPKDMPECPDGKCTCAWFWMHREDSGSEQMYMNGFQCSFPNATSTKKIGPPKLPRRCGPSPQNGQTWDYPNCTYGPKQPFYWLQEDGNNMHEGYYEPPLYLDMYNFRDGAQNDIFIGDYNTSDPIAAISGSAILAASPTQASSSLPSQGTPTSSTGSSTSSSGPATSSSSPDSECSDDGHPHTHSGSTMPSQQPSSLTPQTTHTASPDSTSDPSSSHDSECGDDGDPPTTSGSTTPMPSQPPSSPSPSKGTQTTSPGNLADPATHSSSPDSECGDDNPPSPMSSGPTMPATPSQPFSSSHSQGTQTTSPGNLADPATHTSSPDSECGDGGDPASHTSSGPTMLAASSQPSSPSSPPPQATQTSSSDSSTSDPCSEETNNHNSYRSWNHRDEVDEYAIRRAWGAHHRRSAGSRHY